MNPIQLENLRAGNADWQLSDPATNREIEGYASKTSYNRGEDVVLHINMQGGAAIGTDCSVGQCPSYRLEVFRMGWYSGAGARRVFGPQTVAGYAQPQPILDATNANYAQFGLVECQWTESFRLSTAFSSDADWVSGIYLARLTTVGGSSKQSYIIFAIRDDARSSDFLFQQSVTTYQAYNNWPGAAAGGKSTYPTNSSPFPGAVTEDGHGNQAVKVSFDRPYGVRDNPSFKGDGTPQNSDGSGLLAARFGVGAGEFLTTLNHRHFCNGRGHEYNFVRFLEREGFDVSYATNIDVSQNANLLLKHKGFLSVGHDEYWSKELRDNVEAARDSGLSLGFFSANTCFIQVRFEQNGTGEDRVMVAYKGLGDPCATTTSTVCPAATTVPFRDIPVSRPEHNLLGVAFRTEAGSAGTPAGPESSYFSSDLIIQDIDTWVTADVPVQTGDRLRGLVGYEVDSLPDNSVDWQPGIRVLGASPIPTTASAHMVTFDVGSGATVFSTGTIQWSLGLDDFNCDPVVYQNASGQIIDTQLSDNRAKQITRNVLERFRSRDRTDLFARGTDNAVYWCQRNGGVWQPWQSLGGGFISAPTVSSYSANRLALFAVGLDSQLYQNVWDGSGWNGWIHLGAPAGFSLTSNPAAISRDSRTTDIFVRATSGSDSAMWHRSHDGDAWGAWQSLGGGFASGPAVSSWDANQMLVFAIGLDGALWNKQWVGASWSEWVSLGGPGIPLGLTPAAISREVGKVDVFVRGDDKAIWHRAFAAGWQGWQTLGGGFNTGPGVASWHQNKMVLAAVGLDNQPWLSEWTGSAWTPWESLDGSLTSSPALTCWYGSDR